MARRTVGAPVAAVVAGLGTCLPAGKVDNADLVGILDTSDAWIRSRTGISSRRRVSDDVSVTDLACAAAVNALDSAGAGTVGGVVLATSTPDRPCPPAAPEVAHRLGLGCVPAFDVSAVCSGFVYGLATAWGWLAAGIADSVLVVAAETYSRIVDPADRATAVLFGDGAGAVVVRRGTPEEPGALLAFDLGSDGSGAELIRVPGVRERPDGERWFAMAGRKVYLQAVDRMAASALRVMKDCSWTPETVDAFVPHQANLRIVEAVAGRLGLPAGRAVGALADVGNTAAASIPLALVDALAARVLKPGARTVLSAFGGGLTWASSALIWPQLTPVCTEV
ncbi:ketoacyl-ACP synthase III [Streptomyces sp. TRM S81-3]|uniref:Beta-ketoacyl-[acyl-carrier-protein] synthase III n=1 Tax=Streptomyces griseicoloratus TaxID=2752516 RepID=A0A926L9L4_9ACTN|nr:beta-ketoacyl-ACP synthase III [Streptomyces griseicoloratus]MBD0423929.1 ketoacyl-ACP synthase III [Streptomyces griseicoloratus]